MKYFCFLLLSFIIFQSAHAQYDIELPKPSEDSSEKVFSMVEEEAKFPGGLNAWKTYLTRKLNADVPLNNSAPAGMYRVLIRFIVNKDGRVSDVKVQKDPGYGTAQEAIRVIKEGPNWIPAKQNERNVNAYHLQPITFVVTK